MSCPTAVLVDFDGTAAVQDVGVKLIERFARDESWKVIDNDYENGRVGSRAAYRIVEGLLTGKPDEWIRFALAAAQLDPGLPVLVQTCLESGWRLEILSDGLELYILPMLARAGLDLPVRSNRMVRVGGRLRIFTPLMNPLCGRCGTCKAERVEALTRNEYRVIYIGDGFSDLCAAPRAHQVFAKGVLARHCLDRRVPHQVFDTLDDVARALKRRQNDG